MVVEDWIKSVAERTKPKSIEMVLGSSEQYEIVCQRLIEAKTIVPLNPDLRPESFLARSNPLDVARVEERTFTCTRDKDDAGPTNNWADPQEMRTKLDQLFSGCMEGRIMYVIPFCMGPIGSPYARYGIEITDSPYVVMNLYLMTRLGQDVLDHLRTQPYYVKCLHSVGVPLQMGQKDVSWPCHPDDLYITQFPEELEVIAFGSGYGGNALLNKKSFALRIASYLGHKEGWLAEHMLLVGITNPEGVKKYIAASFPSSCGKTNLALMTPNLPGWKVECVGDDIAWLFWDENGVLRAVNPESGFFGIAPGTNKKTSPVALKTIDHHTLFTNVGLTDLSDVFWQGMDQLPESGTTWLDAPWTKESSAQIAHPNARFTVALSQCPTADPAWNDPKGVEVSAILFGGRRSSLIPLVREARSWSEGVLYGAMMSSETTAAAVGALGTLRHDPFAMLPFCGYNMGEYFDHWLDMGAVGKKLPSIFAVNWFLKGLDGTYIWPGFGDNIRVLDWIFKRLDGQVLANATPIGNLPLESDFNLTGLHCAFSDLFPFDMRGWKAEVDELKRYFDLFKDHFPRTLRMQVSNLETTISS